MAVVLPVAHLILRGVSQDVAVAQLDTDLLGDVGQFDRVGLEQRPPLCSEILLEQAGATGLLGSGAATEYADDRSAHRFRDQVRNFLRGVPLWLSPPTRRSPAAPSCSSSKAPHFVQTPGTSRPAARWTRGIREDQFVFDRARVGSERHAQLGALSNSTRKTRLRVGDAEELLGAMRERCSLSLMLPAGIEDQAHRDGLVVHGSN